MAALRLDLSALKSGHNQVHLMVPPASLGFADPEWPAPLDVSIDADRSGDQVSVNARVTTTSAGECARCLRDFAAPLDFVVHVYADRAGTGGRYEKDLSEDDYVVFHDGRHLDLDEHVREAALLARPMAPLCRSDCRGLCSRCGADWNEGTCPHRDAPGT
jgi:uncharacterized protein